MQPKETWQVISIELSLGWFTGVLRGIWGTGGAIFHDKAGAGCSKPV